MGVMKMVKKVVGHKDEKIKRLQYRLDIAEADKRVAVDACIDNQRQLDTVFLRLRKIRVRAVIAFLIACPGSFVLGGYYLQKLLGVFS
jgi:hypothetical protein